MGVGHWHAPWHGNFEMTPSDLEEMVTHFDEGVAMVEGSNKLPINYGHDISGKAAGWIVRLTVENNGTELWGDVEWTKEGLRMLQEGEFKYISPEWNPRSLPYQDPEDEEMWLDNVFTGAGLTNIPLFKKLKPIMASIVQPKRKQASVVTDDSSKQEGEKTMDLAVLRAKNKDDLSEDELKFVTENSADLTVEERKAFDLQTEEEKTAEAEAAQAAADQEAADAQAAADAAAAEEAGKGVEGAGKAVSISADRLAKLEADATAGRAAAQELAETKAKGFIASAVRKGQIKSGDSDRWTSVLLASSASQRKELETLVSGLPVNESLGKELGDGGIEASNGSAMVELTDRINASIREAYENGRKVLTASAAREQILKADAALAARIKEETEKK